MNFDQLKLNLQGEVTLNYGKFISTVINFLITYKGYNSAVEFIIIGLSRHGVVFVVYMEGCLEKLTEIWTPLDFLTSRNLSHKHNTKSFSWTQRPR